MLGSIFSILLLRMDVFTHASSHKVTVKDAAKISNTIRQARVDKNGDRAWN